jgi:uncharacterized protein involved in exopolysaccharide biosynthesis
MDGLLERLKRERRWTVAFFLLAGAVILTIQGTLAPATQNAATSISPTVTLTEERP